MEPIPNLEQQISSTMDKILSIQNLSNVISPGDLQLQLQLHLQELQRPHQQAPIPTSPLDISHSPLVTQLQNGSTSGINGINGHNSHSPPTGEQISCNNSLASTNGHSKITNGVNTDNLLNEGLTDLMCKLCDSYLIDPATLDICMHTFCRPCAVKYIKDKHRCPECNVEIKDKRCLNRLKTDTRIQSIVYKMIPGLYDKEMERRRDFYAARPTPMPRYRSEMFGDVPPAKTMKPDDMMNISLTWLRPTPDDHDPTKVYFFCRADTTMSAIKKLIVKKFGLDRPVKIYFGAQEIRFDFNALIDVAATFNWNPEYKILNLSFKEHDESKEAAAIKKDARR